MPSELSAQDTILVVDDCRDELGMLMDALEGTNVTAVPASSGIAALHLVESVMPKLILMDAVMPGIDGFETCRRLKRERRFAHLPVIFMTGLKDTEHVVMGLEAGGVDYVVKPVNIDELLARIRVHLANARVAQGARVALDATGRYLLATDSQGQARWCTPQSVTLLSSALKSLDSVDVQLSPDITAQMRALIVCAEIGVAATIHCSDGSDISLSFLGESGADEFLFRVGEEAPPDHLLMRDFDLTAREAEVLIWITRGKANKEISEILAISPRTVNKHLERVFVKLGVENRAAASSVALRALAMQS